MRLHRDQLNKKCISFETDEKIVLQPCELNDEKTFSILRNPAEITYTVDAYGFLSIVSRTPLSKVKVK